MILYVPNKLINAKNAVVAKHNTKKEVSFNPQDTNYKELILRLVALKKDEVEREAYSLTEDEVRIVAAYIPGNCFKVVLTNLFAICTYRANSGIFEALYYSWQNCFSNEACNQFIYSWIITDDGPFNKTVGASYRDDYVSIISEGNVVPAFIEYIKNYRAESDKLIEDVFEQWKLKSSSELCYELKYLFYTYCKKKDYLDISKEELLSFVRRYSYKKITVFKRFLVNFVEELKLSELEKYSALGKYLSSITEMPGTTAFDEFFEGVPQQTVTKYINWINIITLDEVFGQDERSMFWRKYCFKSVKKYPRSNSVVMDMGDYYVTEFLGKAMGPMYFYTKDIFEQKIVGWFKYKDNKEIRTVLLDHKDLSVRREEHRKPYGNEYYWQEQVASILRMYDMTSLIKDE